MCAQAELSTLPTGPSPAALALKAALAAKKSNQNAHGDPQSLISSMLVPRNTRPPKKQEETEQTHSSQTAKERRSSILDAMLVARGQEHPRTPLPDRAPNAEASSKRGPAPTALALQAALAARKQSDPRAALKPTQRKAPKLPAAPTSFLSELQAKAKCRLSNTAAASESSSLRQSPPQTTPRSFSPARNAKTPPKQPPATSPPPLSGPPKVPKLIGIPSGASGDVKIQSAAPSQSASVPSSPLCSVKNESDIVPDTAVTRQSDLSLSGRKQNRGRVFGTREALTASTSKQLVLSEKQTAQSSSPDVLQGYERATEANDREGKTRVAALPLLSALAAASKLDDETPPLILSPHRTDVRAPELLASKGRSTDLGRGRDAPAGGFVASRGPPSSNHRIPLVQYRSGQIQYEPQLAIPTGRIHDQRAERNSQAAASPAQTARGRVERATTPQSKSFENEARTPVRSRVRDQNARLIHNETDHGRGTAAIVTTPQRYTVRRRLGPQIHQPETSQKCENFTATSLGDRSLRSRPIEDAPIAPGYRLVTDPLEVRRSWRKLSARIKRRSVVS